MEITRRLTVVLEMESIYYVTLGYESCKPTHILSKNCKANGVYIQLFSRVVGNSVLSTSMRVANQLSTMNTLVGDARQMETTQLLAFVWEMECI